MTRQFRVLTWSRGLLAPRRSGPLRGEDRLPTGSDSLSVMRGHEGLSLREVVKWLSEVHRCALLSEGTENCSCVLCYSYQSMFYPMWIDTFALNIFIHREVIRLIFVCCLCSLGNMYLLL